MYEAGLIDTDRSIVALEGVNLRTADVSGTVLSGADLRAADLRAADLSGADLSGAYLSGAYLSGARGVTGDQLEHRGRVNLSRANLSGARGVTGDQLEQRALLEGTLMPNGQMYEDWIKDRDNRREAE